MVVCVFCYQPFPLDSCFLTQGMDRPSSSASAVPSIDDYFEHNVWNPVVGDAFSSKLLVFSPPISRKSPWPRSHSLVTLLLIYFVTRKRCLPLHIDTWAPLPMEILLFRWHHCHPRDMFLCFPFLYLLCWCFSLVYVRIHLWLW